MSPHHETALLGLCALPLLYPSCWRCTFLFFFSSGRFYPGSCHSGKENNRAPLLARTEGGESLFLIEAGGRRILNRAKDKERENQGLVGVTQISPVWPPRSAPITLRGSGQGAELGWCGNTDGLPMVESVVGPRQGSSGREARPCALPDPLPRTCCRLAGRHRGAWPGALSTQPSLPQAPSSQASKCIQHPPWLPVQFS